MCGRYHSATPPELIRGWFRVLGPLPNWRPTWNAAPTQSLPVVRFNPQTGARSLDLLRWGLVPSWAKDPKIGAKMINARAETVATLPAFRKAFARRRCIVPADGFYEWSTTDAGKVPYAVGPAEAGTIWGFAGLWEGWKNEAGKWLRSFTILTTTANEALRRIHERMPVILPPEAYGRWLGEEPAEPDELQGLLKPCPPEAVRAWTVSPRVNSVRNDDATLVDPG